MCMYVSMCGCVHVNAVAREPGRALKNSGEHMLAWCEYISLQKKKNDEETKAHLEKSLLPYLASCLQLSDTLSSNMSSTGKTLYE